MKITLEDFQILEGKNDFEFKPGINMVVGPNASGKSSLFYAIENCLTNPNGVSDCINYNHDKTCVRIESNNESVSWIRTQDSSTYINDKTKQKYIKASKLDSRDIADLGFYFDKKNRVVNIHDEWSVLFPFGESDSDMFRLFEDIFNISCSFQIIDEMKKDEQSVRSTITQIQKQKMELEDKKLKLQQIKEKVKSSDVEFYINLLMNSDQRTSELRKSYEKYTKSALLRNITLPKVFDVSELYETYHNYQDIQNNFDKYQNCLKRISITIPEVEVNLDDIIEPMELRNNYEQYCLSKANLRYMQEELTQLENKKIQIQQKISMIKICPTCGRPLE